MKGTKRDAQRELTRLVHESDMGLSIEPNRITVAGLLDRWLDDWARVNVSRQTFLRYGMVVQKHLKPKLGAVKLRELTPMHVSQYVREAIESGRSLLRPGGSPAVRAVVGAVQKLLDETGAASVPLPAVGAKLGVDMAGKAARRPAFAAVRGGYLVNKEQRRGRPLLLSMGKPLPDIAPQALAPSTVALHLHVLKEALGQAVEWELITRNPAAKVKPPRLPDEEVQVLTKEQAGQLIRGAVGHRLFLPIVLALGLGLRRGEVFGLQWCDIDFDASTATVRRSLQEHGLGFKEPKTRRGRRVITMPEFLTLILREQRARRTEERALMGMPFGEEETICCQPDGQPGRLSITNSFDHLLRQLGLPDITFHALRHSHSVLLLADGENPKVVSERLGHADVRITLQVYGRVLPGMAQNAADRLDGMFGQ